jgi:hypothetical protein
MSHLLQDLGAGNFSLTITNVTDFKGRMSGSIALDCKKVLQLNDWVSQILDSYSMVDPWTTSNDRANSFSSSGLPSPCCVHHPCPLSFLSWTLSGTLHLPCHLYYPYHHWSSGYCHLHSYWGWTFSTEIQMNVKFVNINNLTVLEL